jgi:hypothetical protein
MSVLTDGYNCENKNVHVRGEESKLIIRHRERAGWHGIRIHLKTSMQGLAEHGRRFKDVEVHASSC